MECASSVGFVCSFVRKNKTRLFDLFIFNSWLLFLLMHYWYCLWVQHRSNSLNRTCPGCFSALCPVNAWCKFETPTIFLPYASKENRKLFILVILNVYELFVLKYLLWHCGTFFKINTNFISPWKMKKLLKAVCVELCSSWPPQQGRCRNSHCLESISTHSVLLNSTLSTRKN